MLLNSFRSTLSRACLVLFGLVGGHGGVFAVPLRIVYDTEAATLSVFRPDSQEPVLVHNVRADFRPYIHPLHAPDGNGVLTEYSPSHHKHQTGIYWGFTRVNGRDYFHHPEGDYWKRRSVKVLSDTGDGEKAPIRWQFSYALLDAEGAAVLVETQTWGMYVKNDGYVLDLEWSGKAKMTSPFSAMTTAGCSSACLGERACRLLPSTAHGIAMVAQRANGPPGSMSACRSPGGMTLLTSRFSITARTRASRRRGVSTVSTVSDRAPARLGDLKIKKGETTVFRHQLIAYTGQLDDVEMTQRWSRYSGRGGTWDLWGLAQREGREAAFLTPEKALEKMTVQDGFDVNVYASEPMITQPMAFCWDDRGRLWIAENRDYESRGRGFANSGDSRVLILEDTDRDGTIDSRKVFVEGIPFPAAVAVGFDGLWLGAPPNLLFVPDRDGDDVADADDIEVRLTGWGIRDRHETLNSFHWGPDGWLYGCQGFATPSRVGKPVDGGRLFKHKEPFPKSIPTADDPVDIDGGVWRYHPLKDRFEVVAHGFSNPWGIDYDAKGQFFISACVIPHLWHVIPGGIYHRQGGRHFNPYVYSDIRTITDHRHRSAHGGARVYLSDAFPVRYQGQIFMANIHEHAVLTDVLERRGSGFVGRHGEDFLLANNAQWIGFSMEIGPDGGVYVLDWHDGDICGKDVLHKETGRVFRIVPKTSGAEGWEGRYSDLTTLDNAALVSLQTKKSAWHARRARVILQHRASKNGVDDAAKEALRKLLRSKIDADHRLRALWALHVTKGFQGGELEGYLDDADEYIRAWSIQLLCEDNNPGAGAIEKLVELAAEDPSAVVRLYVAAALQRLPADARWAPAMALVRREEDADDHNIPKMVWFGVEPLVAASPKRALEVAENSRLPLVTRHIARRLTDAGKLEELVAGIGASRGAQVDLLNGLLDGLEGQNDVAAPASWDKVYDALQKSGVPDVPPLALRLAQGFGDTGAADKLMAALKDEAAALERRRDALRSLASQRLPALKGELFRLLDVEPFRQEAIRALASYEDDQVAKVLLGRYAKLSAAEKLEAVHTLAARPKSGWQLAQAIRTGTVPRRDVPAYVARQLRRVVGSGFVEIWGPLDAAAVEKDALFAKYRALLTDDALAKASPSRGRAVFERTCTSCHTLYDQGGIVGPDITGSNRSDLNYILGNMLSPSDVIQDDYRMLVILTNEGRAYSGILAGESERQLQLRVAGQNEPVVIGKSSIASREISPGSMMPEGLLANLADEEVLDLVAYLRTTEQVPLPADN